MHQGGASTFMTVKLTNALATSVHRFSESGEEYDELAFTYQKIEWTWVDGGVTTEDDWATPSV